MEREIKFRGKRVDKEEFAFGDLLTGMGYKKGRFFVLPHLSYYPSDCHSVDGYEVIPETIGQYIGLKDQNGKEIYEGDIVKNKEVGGYGMVYIGVVKYYEEDCRFGIDLTATNKFTKRCLFTVGKCSFNDGHCTIEYYNEYEVLGNIHDNPELLKDGRD